MNEYESSRDCRNFSYYFTPEPRVDVRGYDYLIQNISSYALRGKGIRPWTHEVYWGATEEGIIMSYEAPHLIIKIGAQEPLKVDIVSYVKHELPAGNSKHHLVIESESADVAYRISFKNLNGKIKDGEPQLEGFGFEFFYRMKKQ